MACQKILISNALCKDTITRNVSVGSVPINWAAPGAVVNYLANDWTMISERVSEELLMLVNP
jgi:hypothetical protein